MSHILSLLEDNWVAPLNKEERVKFEECVNGYVAQIVLDQTPIHELTWGWFGFEGAWDSGFAQRQERRAKRWMNQHFIRKFEPLSDTWRWFTKPGCEYCQGELEVYFED